MKNWIQKIASRVIYSACVFLLPFHLLSQIQKDWDRRLGSFGPDAVYQILPYQGNYLLIGDTQYSGISGDKGQLGDRWDGWLVNIKEDRDTMWTHTVVCEGTAGNENCIVLNDSLIIASKTGEPGSPFCGLPKGIDLQIKLLHPDKSIAWSKRYNGIGLADVSAPKITTCNDDLLVFCTCNADSGNDKSENHIGLEPFKGNSNWDDFWILKLDKTGNKIWDKTVGGSDRDGIGNYFKINNDEYLVVGYSKSPAGFDKTDNTKGGFDSWLLKIDGNGNIMWDKTFGGDKDDAALGIIPFGDGYLIHGYSRSGISGDKSQPNKGGADFWIIKIDSDGNKYWDKSFGGSGDDYLTDALPTPDGGAILAGFSNLGLSGDRTEGSWGDYDYWIVKIDANGNKMWDKSFGSSGSDRNPYLALTPSGDLMIAGRSNGMAFGDKSQDTWGDYDYWVVKTKPADPMAFDEIWLESTRENGGLLMRWHDYADPESGNSYLIQRKGDEESHWKTIDTVRKNTGSYLGKTAYLGKDRNPPEGFSLYRIKRIGPTFEYRYSNVIQSFWSGVRPRIYPNPFTDELTLSWGAWKKDPGEVKVRFYNWEGKKLLETTQYPEKETLKVNTSTLPPGGYAIEVQYSIHKFTLKAVKE